MRIAEKGQSGLSNPYHLYALCLRQATSLPICSSSHFANFVWWGDGSVCPGLLPKGCRELFHIDGFY